MQDLTVKLSSPKHCDTQHEETKMPVFWIYTGAMASFTGVPWAGRKRGRLALDQVAGSFVAHGELSQAGYMWE